MLRRLLLWCREVEPLGEDEDEEEIALTLVCLKMLDRVDSGAVSPQRLFEDEICPVGESSNRGVKDNLSDGRDGAGDGGVAGRSTSWWREFFVDACEWPIDDICTGLFVCGDGFVDERKERKRKKEK